MSLAALAGFGAQAGLDYFNTQAANNASKASQKRQFKFADEQAGKAMDFTKEMSNTSHQREKLDLIASGLNPILTANAGASAGAGSAGSGSSYTAQKSDTDVDPYLLDTTRQNALNRQQSKATIANTTADTGLKSANTESAKKSLEVSQNTINLLKAQTSKEGEQARMSKQAADLNDKYGEAQTVMGLINSGTGAVGNLFSPLKGLIDLGKPKTHYTPAPSKYKHISPRE